MIAEKNTISHIHVATSIAGFAVQALLEEVQLSPKPGLVDRYNNGTHHDLTLDLMERSARVLHHTFFEMVMATIGKQPSPSIREQLAAIGRYGEQQMLKETGQVNTHKGAIWALGLISGAVGILIGRESEFSAAQILHVAGSIAAFKDRFMPGEITNGARVKQRYQVRGAREEAIAGFPSILNIALPASEKYRNELVDISRLNMLFSLMSEVEDTCILHRSNMEVLREVQLRSRIILDQGGASSAMGQKALAQLDKYLTEKWVSPGGSADLLAATIFLQKILNHFKNYRHGIIFI